MKAVRREHQAYEGMRRSDERRGGEGTCEVCGKTFAHQKAADAHRLAKHRPA